MRKFRHFLVVGQFEKRVSAAAKKSAIYFEPLAARLKPRLFKTNSNRPSTHFFKASII
jgi:hypothetical protein